MSYSHRFWISSILIIFGAMATFLGIVFASHFFFCTDSYILFDNYVKISFIIIVFSISMGIAGMITLVSGIMLMRKLHFALSLAKVSVLVWLGFIAWVMLKVFHELDVAKMANMFDVDATFIYMSSIGSVCIMCVFFLAPLVLLARAIWKLPLAD